MKKIPNDRYEAVSVLEAILDAAVDEGIYLKPEVNGFLDYLEAVLYSYTGRGLW